MMTLTLTPKQEDDALKVRLRHDDRDEITMIVGNLANSYTNSCFRQAGEAGAGESEGKDKAKGKGRGKGRAKGKGRGRAQGRGRGRKQPQQGEDGPEQQPGSSSQPDRAKAQQQPEQLEQPEPQQPEQPDAENGRSGGKKDFKSTEGARIYSNAYHKCLKRTGDRDKAREAGQAARKEALGGSKAKAQASPAKRATPKKPAKQATPKKRASPKKQSPQKARSPKQVANHMNIKGKIAELRLANKPASARHASEALRKEREG